MTTIFIRKPIWIAACCAVTGLIAANPARAGVVYEVEVTDHSQSPPQIGQSEMSAQGQALKMSILDREGGKSEMVYRGDRREMLTIDHESKSYFVIDKAMMQGLASQLNTAMSQVQEMLKNVPESQRAAVEKMMKERIPGLSLPAEAPKIEFKNTGDKETKNGYPCVRHEVWIDGKKIRELWLTDWKNVSGGDEVASLFQEMAAFFSELTQAFSSAGPGMPGMANLNGNIFAYMKELDGFPVITREFGETGSLDGESNLRSATERALNPADFEPPAGYERQQMPGVK